VKFATLHQLLPRLRLGGTIPLLRLYTYMLSCRGQRQFYLNSTGSCTCASHEGILGSPRIQLHSFLTSVLNGGELSTFGSGRCFTSSIKVKVLGSRRLGGPHRRGRGGCYGVDKTILPLPGNEIRLIGLPAAD